jgi:uncharacterized protein RhaS with RHS repeats
MYSPVIGRYLTPDPVGLFGGFDRFGYVAHNPVNWIDPFGLVRWGQLGSSVLGLVGNGLGIFVGSILLGTPEPTLATKAIGAVVVGKSTVGWGLNWYNLTQSFNDSCEKYDAPASAARAVATVVSPGNQDAQAIADVVDLSIDFASGRGAAYAYKTTFGIATKGPKFRFDPSSKILTNPSIVPAFQTTQVTAIGIDNVAR